MPTTASTTDNASNVRNWFDTALADVDYNDLYSLASTIGVDLPKNPTKDQIVAAILDGDAPSESASKRDGAFSYAAEWHAFTVGFYAGFADFADFDGLSKKALKNEDVIAEPHYAKGGYVLGAFTRTALVAATAFGAGSALF